MPGRLRSRSLIYGVFAIILCTGVVTGWLYYDTLLNQGSRIYTLALEQVTGLFGSKQETVTKAPPVAKEPLITDPSVSPQRDRGANKPKAPSPPDSQAVSFDTVRLDENSFVVAGRAPPRAVVTLLGDQRKTADVKSENLGSSPYLGKATGILNKKSTRRQILRLQITPENAPTFEADAFVVLARARNKVKTTVKEQSKPVIVSVETMRTRVLQSPNLDRSADFSIDVVDYNSKGNLYLGGLFRKSSKGVIAVYINNHLVANQISSIAAKQGVWEVHTYSDIPAGEVYVRVDLIVNKRVLSRRRIKFRRTKEVLLSPDLSKVIVRKGDTLWKIAKYVYDSGFRYIWIFEHNKEQIVDPDIIYPEQIFNLPKGDHEAGKGP